MIILASGTFQILAGEGNRVVLVLLNTDTQFMHSLVIGETDIPAKDVARFIDHVINMRKSGDLEQMEKEKEKKEDA